MNRIILVGNGFDLAHGLKTSYTHFINNLWFNKSKKISETESNIYIDDDLRIETSGGQNFSDHWRHTDDICSYFSFKEYMYQLQDKLNNTKIRLFPDIYFSYFNDFLKKINNNNSLNNWVDIENVYYETMLHCCNHIDPEYGSIKTLNEQFSRIKQLLEKYLTMVQNTRVKGNNSRDEDLYHKIYSSFDINDISQSSSKKFSDDIICKIKTLGQSNHSEREFYLYKSLYNHLDCDWDDVIGFKTTNQERIKSSETSWLNRELKYKRVPILLTIPDIVLFLNFNYTNTTNLYVNRNDIVEIIHIHGELNNKENPIIFGYGDELDENYKIIETLNNNEYLENIKSIQYLNTDNYRRLLNFLELDTFQIMIFGHSCGNSDRTLLNTLFEHKNCVSIKPFYYKDHKGDNYSEIVKNISRNFTDKKMMRDRVVNKTYCEPLIGQK